MHNVVLARRVIRFVFVLILATVMMISGLGVVQAPKVQAAKSTDGKCRVALSVDTSGSIENLGQLQSQIEQLFGAFGADGDKIYLTFWSFAGPGEKQATKKGITSEPHEKNYGDGTINPWHYGYAVSSSPSAPFNKQVEAMKADGLTNYGWAFAYKNNGTQNSAVDTEANAADIIVLMTDGQPTAPRGGVGVDQADKDWGRAQADKYRNSGTILLGLPFGNKGADAGVIGYVIANNSNVITAAGGGNVQYTDIAAKVRDKVKTTCGTIITQPCPPPYAAFTKPPYTTCPDPTTLPRFNANNGDIFTNGLINAYNSGGNLAAIAGTSISGYTSGQGGSLTIPSYTSGYSPVPSAPAPANCPPTWTGADIHIPAYAVTGYISCDFGSKNVYIDGPITYDANALFDLNTLQLLKIYTRGNIYISPSVNTVNAVLMTTNTLYTCYQAGLTVNTIDTICRKPAPLLINGAIAATNLRLYRNFRNSPDFPAHSPANPTPSTIESASEIFTFTPESWLWALSGSPTGATAFDGYTIMPPIL